MYRRPMGYYGSSLGFPLTPMVRNLIAINCVVYLLQSLTQLGRYAYIFELSVSGVLQDAFIWQPFTYMWLHGSPLHLFFNMLSLYMFGPQLEAVWGSQRFLRFYLICGLGAGAFIFLGNWLVFGVTEPTIGASGAIFGVLTAFSLLWPDRTILLLFPPIPLRALYFIPFLFLMTLTFSGGANISHIGHLGGAVTGAFILRDHLRRAVNINGLRYRWHRYRMKGRLRAIQREDWERRRRGRDDGPTLH